MGTTMPARPGRVSGLLRTLGLKFCVGRGRRGSGFEVRDLRFEFQGLSLPGRQVLSPRTLGGCRKAPSLFQTVPRDPKQELRKGGAANSHLERRIW